MLSVHFNVAAVLTSYCSITGRFYCLFTVSFKLTVICEVYTSLDLIYHFVLECQLVYTASVQTRSLISSFMFVCA